MPDHALPTQKPQDDDERARALHAALAAYGLSRRQLRRLAGLAPAELHAALRHPDPPRELRALLRILAALLTPQRRDAIRAPADVAGLLMVRLGHCDQEQLHVVCLDAQNGVQDIALVYQGSVCRAVVRLAEVFKRAMQLNSCAVILAHNHPASSMVPSDDDLVLTRSCARLGRQLGVALLDHLIIGAGQWLSIHSWLANRQAAGRQEAVEQIRQGGT